jgi:5-carboxymethyl-2-hydroxymuconate isomerase
MPHLVLEHSANLAEPPDFGSVLERLHAALSADGPFELHRIKSRVVRHEVFRVAEGAEDRSFVHLTAAVLDGRETPLLQATAGALLAVLRDAFAAALSRQRCSVTLEIREMPHALYFKL